MATHANAGLIETLDTGYKPGTSLSHFQRSLKGQGLALEQSLKGHQTLNSGRLGSNESSEALFIAPYDCEITAIKVVKGTLTGAGVSVALNNRDAQANTNKNPLTTATVDLDGLTDAFEAVTVTLSSTTANKQMNVGDVLSADFACDGSSTTDGCAVLVEYKPIVALD